jgi:hypothetical protein
MDLEEVWRIREEDVYPVLFGPRVRGIFPLQMEMFTGQFGQSNVDPRWLHYGVLEFAPTETRHSWLYVTSGHSNPWEQLPDEFDPDGESGAGAEFTLATKGGITRRKVIAMSYGISSRGNRTAIELFLSDVKGWPSR